MEKKSYKITPVGVSGFGAKLEILEGKFKGLELTSYITTPENMVNKHRTIENCIDLALLHNTSKTVEAFNILSKG